MMKSKFLVLFVAILAISAGFFFYFRRGYCPGELPPSSEVPRFVVLNPVLPEDTDKKDEMRWGKLGVYSKLLDSSIVEKIKAAPKSYQLLLAGYRDGICIVAGDGPHIVARSSEHGHLVYFTRMAHESVRYLFASLEFTSPETPTYHSIVDESLYDEVGRIIRSVD